MNSVLFAQSFLMYWCLQIYISMLLGETAYFFLNDTEQRYIQLWVRFLIHVHTSMAANVFSHALLRSVSNWKSVHQIYIVYEDLYDEFQYGCILYFSIKKNLLKQFSKREPRAWHEKITMLRALEKEKYQNISTP